jgi:ribulose-phosphate 3-epimerase
MPTVCPTVLAADEDAYRAQIERVAPLGHRIQIDLTDSVFAPTKTVKPEQVWWPIGFRADIHFMYRNPLGAIKEILPHQPNLIIVHAEAQGDFNDVVSCCRHAGVKIGVALLPQTAPEHIFPALNDIDHVLIFSGDLGSFGGHADLSLLGKVSAIKERKPDIEIGWDGGVNSQNLSQLVTGGVDVLNVGGFIQKAEDPEKAYRTLVRIADETGTT